MVLTLDRWIGKVAVVTGASAGCGAAIATALVENGLKVVGLARRKDRLDQLQCKLSGKKGEFHAVECDITSENDIKLAFKWTKENLGPVAVLINNAGISQPTSLIGGDCAMWRKILETNVLGLSIATREAIDQMQAYKVLDGQIVHINSILGHYVAQVPKSNMYPASKFAVTALTETLRQELNAMGSNIRITSVSPGPVETEFASASNLLENRDFAELYTKMPKLKAEDVADAVVYVLSTPPHVQTLKRGACLNKRTKMGNKSTRTFLTIKNETTTDITSTSVDAFDDFDWVGWDRPWNQLRNWRICAKSDDTRPLQVKNRAANCPYTLKLHFGDGSEDVVRIKQKLALGNGSWGVHDFEHQVRNHDCTIDRYDYNTLRINVKNTGQQLQAESLKEEAKKLRQENAGLAEALQKIRKACELNKKDGESVQLKAEIESECQVVAEKLFGSGFDKEAAGDAVGARADFATGVNLAEIQGKNASLLAAFKLKMEANEVFNQAVKMEEDLLDKFDNLLKTNQLEELKSVQTEYINVISNFEKCKELMIRGQQLNGKFSQNNVEMLQGAIDAARDKSKEIDAKCLEVSVKQLKIAENEEEVNEAHKNEEYYHVLE